MPGGLALASVSCQLHSASHIDRAWRLHQGPMPGSCAGQGQGAPGRHVAGPAGCSCAQAGAHHSWHCSELSALGSAALACNCRANIELYKPALRHVCSGLGARGLPGEPASRVLPPPGRRATCAAGQRSGEFFSLPPASHAVWPLGLHVRHVLAESYRLCCHSYLAGRRLSIAALCLAALAHMVCGA